MSSFLSSVQRRFLPPGRLDALRGRPFDDFAEGVGRPFGGVYRLLWRDGPDSAACADGDDLADLAGFDDFAVRPDFVGRAVAVVSVAVVSVAGRRI